MAIIDLGKILTQENVDSSLSATSTNPVENRAVYAALQSIGGGSGLLPPMTQAQYYAITNKEQTLYFIVDADGNLQKIYYGNFLLAKREASSTATNVGFPLVFPIIFN